MIEKILSSGCFSLKDAKEARRELVNKYHLWLPWIFITEKLYRYAGAIAGGLAIAAIYAIYKELEEYLEEEGKEA